MITKEMLREYGVIKKELLGIERHLEELESAVYNIRGGRLCLSGRHSKTMANEDFSGLLVKLMDVRVIYERKWDELIDARKRIEEAVEALPGVQRTLLRAKYIEGLSWEEAADRVGYSLRQAHRLVGTRDER